MNNSCGIGLHIFGAVLRRKSEDLDNLVLAACRRAKADHLVTSDQSLIAHADVIAKTPEEMLALMGLGI